MTWKNVDDIKEVISYLEAIDPDVLINLHTQLDSAPISKEEWALGFEAKPLKQEEIIARVTLCKKALESVLKNATNTNRC